jgi:hypothetical protein
MANTESVSHHDLIVCACGGREYSVRDAIEAALYRGELEPLWKKFLRRVAAEKKADETDMDVDEDAIDSAAEAFRYQHDLITAEETEQWLAMRDLTLDDFSNYFVRQFCGSALDDIAGEEVDYLAAPDELRQLFAVEMILSGDVERMTTQLSWRLATAAAIAAGKEALKPEAIEAERARFFQESNLSATQLPQWLEQLGHDAEWFEEMVRMEAAFRARSETLITPQSRQREIATLRLALTRFETEVIEVESRDAAQEALFCVREDGMSMEEVASEGRYPYRCVSFLQEDIPGELQQKFLSVVVGEVVDPLSRGDGFELYRVMQKIEPKADDPTIQERVEGLILGRHFSELAARHVEPRLRGVSAHE